MFRFLDRVLEPQQSFLFEIQGKENPREAHFQVERTVAWISKTVLVIEGLVDLVFCSQPIRGDYRYWRKTPDVSWRLYTCTELTVQPRPEGVVFRSVFQNSSFRVFLAGRSTCRGFIHVAESHFGNTRNAGVMIYTRTAKDVKMHSSACVRCIHSWSMLSKMIRS